MSLGIDIGTGSVRSYSFPDGATAEVPITTVHGTDPSVVTQSSEEIFRAIEKTALAAITKNTRAITIAATCSMVVRELVSVDGDEYLVPFSVEESNSSTSFVQDIILWMDSRATEQTEKLNQILDEKTLCSVGGRVIPEMGMPKLKYVSDRWPGKNLVAFEMYDWFSYVLMEGLSDMVRYHRSKLAPIESTAMDGSIKGMSALLLRAMQCDVTIGRTEYASDWKTSAVPPLGYPLGSLHKNYTDHAVVVGHGCIDCYGGWLSCVTGLLLLLGSNPDGVLSMIAGTSTCFLVAVPAENTTAIPGVWGPYGQLLGPEFKPLYEFGQPASGKLFEQLFAEYGLGLSMSEFFTKLENDTTTLEKNESITSLLRGYFYYGDKFGNRSPYNEFSMREVSMDAPDVGVPIAVRKYHLTMEFLVLQMKQVVEIVEKHSHIGRIVVSGSQSQNTRLVNMIKTVMPDKQVLVVSSKMGKTNGARGAAVAGQITLGLHESTGPYHDVFVEAIDSCNQDVSTSEIKMAANRTAQKVLEVKYNLLKQIGQLQLQYRHDMASID